MMSKLPEMPALEEALEEDSWSWLETNAPKLAAAVREEVGRGVTPEAMMWLVREHERPKLATVVFYAARFLVRGREGNGV